MSDKLSRRQILRLGGGLAIGAVGTTSLWSGSSLTQPSLAISTNVGQSAFFTRGANLYNPYGIKVVLKGINLPLLDDWGFPQSNTLAELAQTGANAVRIQWYKDYGQPSRPAYSVADLDRFLSECRKLSIIPILYLNDLTCQADPNLLNSQLLPWWTSDPVVSVLKKHERYLIINLANELGHYRWSSNKDEALANFVNAYTIAIAGIRKYLRVPIAIDAPDCGTSIEVFPKIAQTLIGADPLHNLLFSGHAYWASYDGMSYLQAAINANVPIFFGEIANKQDEEVNGATQYCYYNIDVINRRRTNAFSYQSLLTYLQSRDIGWLAWSWWKDNCSSRQITLNGSMSGLTPYGKDIVDNRSYGLKSTAKRVTL
jgi:mannan endo-1,4-beta-mannosidase